MNRFKIYNLYRYGIILAVTIFILPFGMIIHAADIITEPIEGITELAIDTVIQQNIAVVETQTDIFQIQYAQAIDIEKLLQNLLSPQGKISRDDRTNHIIVRDTEYVIKNIRKLIEAVDIPLETLIIPIKYTDANEIAKLLTRVASPRTKISVDSKLNSIIITDIASHTAKVRDFIQEIQANINNQSQMGLDCSIIKIILNDENRTGIDWSQSPFIRKSDNQTGALFLENIDSKKLLNWLGKFGTAELISRKRIALTPNEETRLREGIRYQIYEKEPAGVNSAGETQYKISSRGEDFGFTYRFLARPTDLALEQPPIILSFNVDGILPQGGSTAAYSINKNNVRIYPGMTLLTEDIRRIPVADGNVLPLMSYDNLNLILLITPFQLNADIK